MEQEIWKDIILPHISYEWLYQVSNLWRIKSVWRYDILWRYTEEIIRKLSISNWYYRLWLNKDWKSKQYLVHRLIAQAFIPNPENKPYINHIDWIRSNNKLDNIEWCTSRENNIHRYNVLLCKKANVWKFWALHKQSKKVNQYDLQWNFIKEWWWLRDVQRNMWIKYQWISMCCIWKYKQSWWFIWRYS